MIKITLQFTCDHCGKQVVIEPSDAQLWRALRKVNVNDVLLEVAGVVDGWQDIWPVESVASDIYYPGFRFLQACSSECAEKINKK